MGTLYKNGIPYGGGGGGGDNSKTVTYEQYKNLSEAEKKNGTTYYIPDYPYTGHVTELGFIDTTKILIGNHAVEGNTTETYLATEDCYVVATLCGYDGQNGGSLKIDNIIVCLNYVEKGKGLSQINVAFPVKKGQTVSVYSNQSYASYFAVYGMGYSDIGGNSTDIVDNLESTDTNKALSANMGRELNEEIDNINSDLSVVDYSSKIKSDYFDVSRLKLKKTGNIVVLNGTISPLSNVSIPGNQLVDGTITFPSECASVDSISQYVQQVNINSIILFKVQNIYASVYVYGTTAYNVGSYAINLTWVV